MNLFQNCIFTNLTPGYSIFSPRFANFALINCSFFNLYKSSFYSGVFSVVRVEGSKFYENTDFDITLDAFSNFSIVQCSFFRNTNDKNNFLRIETANTEIYESDFDSNKISNSFFYFETKNTRALVMKNCKITNIYFLRRLYCTYICGSKYIVSNPEFNYIQLLWRIE